MFFGNNFQTLEIVPPALRCGGIYFAGALIEPRVGRILKPRECAGQKPIYEAAEHVLPQLVQQRDSRTTQQGKTRTFGPRARAGLLLCAGRPSLVLRVRHGLNGCFA